MAAHTENDDGDNDDDDDEKKGPPTAKNEANKKAINIFNGKKTAKISIPKTILHK